MSDRRAKGAVVFDLDDTLYAEATYVASGFRAVSAWLEIRAGVPSQESVNFLEVRLDADGRGKLFDSLIKEFGLRGISVRKMVSVYRAHSPKIALHNAAPKAIQDASDFTGTPVHVITDGNRLVQRKKAAALELQNFVDKIWFTRDFGIHREKPNPFIFQMVAQSLELSPRSLIYVGDDPTKDFRGPRIVGGRSVRVRQGRMASVEAKDGYEPDLEIDHIGDLRAALHQLEKQERS